MSGPLSSCLSREKVDVELSQWLDFSLCLPHPYKTKYAVRQIARDSIATAPEQRPKQSKTSFRLFLLPNSQQDLDHVELPHKLHNEQLSFDILIPGQRLSLANNTSWARARRSPAITFTWTSVAAPSLGQIWLLIYALFTVHHEEEMVRLNLIGIQTDVVRTELIAHGLAISHPLLTNKSTAAAADWMLGSPEIILLRSSFWQGAGSPVGTRSIWSPGSVSPSRQPLHTFPVIPTTQTITTKFPETQIHTLHPIRPAKPVPGSLIYSRWIPQLSEHFSMIALDYTNDEHLFLFHTWQNDPRVAAGWNETGTVEQHRHYLKTLHEDLHTFTILAYFDATPFAYFEVYWAKEDHLGVYYIAGDWDRGRHSLVGNSAFLGRSRAHAWWSSLMHYIFLDDPRTEACVGEPKWTNDRVLQLDADHGFHVEKWVDLPHKRSALAVCSRERFFQMCTVGKPYAGTAKIRDIREKL